MNVKGKYVLGFCFFSLLSGTALAAPSDKAIAAEAAKDSVTAGILDIGGQHLAYHATAGTIAVHGSKYDDSESVLKKRGDLQDDGDTDSKKSEKDTMPKKPAVASMFYTAYFKDNAAREKRPIIFFYNGGPGSASLWLHLGSFGPMRVAVSGDGHVLPPPYKLKPNAESLLDIADLVFIDAPGTGFGRIGGDDAEKVFYSVDGDAHAFVSFIEKFLAKYERYNSPRYLFGESYGTLRSAVAANELQKDGLDLNGVILLSQILSYDNNIDTPDFNPGNDLPYALALPTYAATAWYHNKLPEKKPAELQPFLKEVENFAMAQYLPALMEGNELPDLKKHSIARKMHLYTGLSEEYIYRADLRITGLMFTHELQRSEGLTTGRLGTEYSGPAMDLMEKNSFYDPQSSAISSAYISTFNQYVRQTLKYGKDLSYHSENDAANEKWETAHRLPQTGDELYKATTNVMPDLAMALKTNPNLKIMLNGGYYDLATPYYEGLYEMNHLPISADLQKNIETYQYPAGHMVYLNANVLKDLRRNVVKFIKQTSSNH